MNDDDLAQQLMAIFLDELHEHVSNLGTALLALEKQPSLDELTELWGTIFRAAHTLKGASAVVDIQPITRACHHMEDIFGHYRDGQSTMPSEMVSLMLDATDAIEDTEQRLRAGETLDDAPLINFLPRLQQVAAETTGKSGAPTQPESPAPIEAEFHPSTVDLAPEAEPPTPVEEEIDMPPASPVTKTRQTTTAKRAALAEASIRVPAQKLDALLSQSGELLVARGRFALRAQNAAEVRELASELRTTMRPSASSRTQPSLTEPVHQKLSALVRQIDTLASGMEADNRLLDQTCSVLDDEIYHVRMLPFDDACGGLERAVRDIARSTDKQVAFQIEGADVEVDRSVLEGLKDPLLHLVRNAVDHGIESPSQRHAAGKPAEAAVTVSASLCGGQVEVRVEDDGRGLDLSRICAIARKRNLEIPDDRREQARLIFTPGFSTAKMITDISGRGIGLDVVRNRVESLHGSVEVSFQEGRGTQFTFTAPLTLTMIRSMLVQVDEQIFAIPTGSIARLVRYDIDDIRPSTGRDTLLLREGPTPLVSLAATLGLKPKAAHLGATEKRLAIILTAGDQQLAVGVDGVLAEKEVLVKNLGARVRRLRFFSGCTLLPTGRVALVVNTANVVRTGLGQAMSTGSMTTGRVEVNARKHLLLVDDSVTTRLLLKNILETAGYDVVAAVDGGQGWEIAQQQEFDAVVSDVDMPRVDGFALTERLRAHEPTSDIPIILVTARGSDDDKRRGIQVGASAYIVKGSFDQKVLLDTLAQLA